jgi:hypothetical protein
MGKINKNVGQHFEKRMVVAMGILFFEMPYDIMRKKYFVIKVLSVYTRK